MDAAMEWPPLPTLKGHIEYRLDLTDDIKQTSRESLSTQSRKKFGYFFLPQHQEATDINNGVQQNYPPVDGSEEYSLVIPQCLAKMVCDAARSNALVTLTKYSTRKIISLSSTKQLTILNLHPDGMMVHDSSFGFSRHNLKKDHHDEHLDSITLSELNKIECCENDDIKQQGETNILQTKNRKNYFTVSATVDAISPIITAVPSDPFALIEIYEKGDDEHDFLDQDSCPSINGPMSAVVVLRGKAALACHAGIHPGDSIVFKHVRKQRWHVPSSLEKKNLERLHIRAPSHVLVVDKALSVSWGPGVLEQSSSACSELCSSPITSTIAPLTSIQGKIVSIKHKQIYGKKGYNNVIHSIDFMPQTQQLSSIATLYVTYYPLAQSESLGLVHGTIIRAINVHELSLGAAMDKFVTAYGACLRSTITILHCSPDKVTSESPTGILPSEEHVAHRPRKRPRVDINVSNLDDMYVFSRITQPYKSLVFQDHLERWHKEFLANCNGNTFWTPLLPTFDELLHVLVQPDSGDTTSGVGQISNNKKKKRKTKQRDPYVEFFDHGHNDFDVIDATSEGCEPCCSDISKRPWPALVGLEKIRSSSVQKMHKEIISILKPAKSPNQCQHGGVQRSSDIRGGWSASIHLSGKSLVHEMLELDSNTIDSGNVSNPHEFKCCTGGILTSHATHGQYASISDGLCEIPLCEVSSTQIHKENPSHLQKNVSFVTVEIESAIVSCICLGAVRGASQSFEKHSTDTMREIRLPSLESLKPHRTRAQLKGSCSFFELCQQVFLVSVQLRCRSCQVVHKRIAKSAPSAEKIQTPSKNLDLHECLRSSFFASPKADKVVPKPAKFMVGMLTRLRFKFARVRGNCYNDCFVTLSDDSSTGSNHGTSLQTVAFKLSVPIPFEKRKKVQQCIEELIGMPSLIGVDDQISLATAWWSIADASQSAALVAGGWDEYQNGDNENINDIAQLCKVRVQIPLTTIQQSKQGYVRIRVGLDSLRACCSSAEQGKITHQVAKQAKFLHGVFDYIGGLKFLPGMLDRRPTRRTFPNLSPRLKNKGILILGELSSCPNLWSIPTSTISGMIESVCRGIKNQSKAAVEPSLVQLVPDARLLTITYCRAQAECSRCFKFLSDKTDTRNGGKWKSNNTSGVVSSVSLTEEENFWCRPLPINHSTTAHAPQKQNEALKEQRQDGSNTSTNLCCPNNCPVEYANIKWECSGILDDGTGQAKLYAEREAALTLLGESIDAEAIEDGAWKMDGGVIFSKGVPPKSYVKQAVLEAQSLARQVRMNLPHNSKQKARPLNEKDILSLLTPETRAEYLLQRHCRFSKDPNRPLDFFCRCKPIADGNFHLNQTQLDVVSRRSNEESDAIAMDITSYSLFPLKLNLVDCCSAENSIQTSWDKVKALENM